jgi:hypothetical protein
VVTEAVGARKRLEAHSEPLCSAVTRAECLIGPLQSSGIGPRVGQVSNPAQAPHIKRLEGSPARAESFGLKTQVVDTEGLGCW